MKYRFISALLLGAMLGACAPMGVELPIVAVDQTNGERYIGTAISSRVGESSFSFVSESGISCSGTYTARTSSSGTGMCSNGQSTSWTVTGDLRGGQGFGELGGRRALVYYGNFAVRQQIR
jgi:hypothetical protein